MGQHRRFEIDIDKLSLYTIRRMSAVRGIHDVTFIRYAGEGECEVPVKVQDYISRYKYRHRKMPSLTKILYDSIVESQYVPFEMI